MRRVILFRHAKSSWSDPDLEDHDRPLTQRGRMAASLMGAWLADKGYRPDLVLVSSSARTQETWARARRAFEDPPPAETDPNLYHADPAAMLRRLQAAPADAETVALVGHQPGIGSLCRRLAAPEAPTHCRRAFEKFPTAAIAVLDFEADAWPEIDFGRGRFHLFVPPRELV
jgi:phosphohistidine phosphatase